MILFLPWYFATSGFDVNTPCIPKNKNNILSYRGIFYFAIYYIYYQIAYLFNMFTDTGDRKYDCPSVIMVGTQVPPNRYKI